MTSEVIETLLTTKGTGFRPKELEQFLLYFGLPVAAPKDMDAAVFLRAMRTDKKVMSGQIRYIVLSALGKASIVDDISANEMTAVIG